MRFLIADVQGAVMFSVLTAAAYSFFSLLVLVFKAAPFLIVPMVGAVIGVILFSDIN